MWFWSVSWACKSYSIVIKSSSQRADIPASILQSTSTSSIDLSDWGTPSASYPSVSCNMTTFFTDQQLVLDITLCGDWCASRFLLLTTIDLCCLPSHRAGIGPVYNATCGNSGPTGLCVRASHNHSNHRTPSVHYAPSTSSLPLHTSSEPPADHKPTV